MTRFPGMRWVAGGAVAVVMAVCAFGAMAASGGGRAALRSASRGCYPKGSTTIAQDKVGRFYLLRGASSRGLSRRPWFYCAFRHATPHQLPYRNGTPGPPYGPHSATTSGRYLAFFVYGGDAPRCCGSVIVIDMVAGHGTFTGAVNAGSTMPIGPFPSVLVLKSNGSVAWIYGSEDSAEVHRHDSTGTAIVDS